MCIRDRKYNVYIKAAFRKAGLTRMVTTIDTVSYTHLDVYKRPTLAKTDRFREPLRLIMSVPGFGQATGMAFLSEICDITRFRNAEQLAAYILSLIHI